MVLSKNCFLLEPGGDPSRFYWGKKVKETLRKTHKLAQFSTLIPNILLVLAQRVVIPAKTY